jgi:hypothetical protein
MDASSSLERKEKEILQRRFKTSNPQVYHLREVLKPKDLEDMTGEFLTLNESTTIITDDADVYKPNGGVFME